MTNAIILAEYLLGFLISTYLGVLFVVWIRKARAISTIWKYETAMFISIAYSKILVAVCRFLLIYDEPLRDEMLHSILWQTRDIPLIVVLGWFAWEMSDRFFNRRRKKK